MARRRGRKERGDPPAGGGPDVPVSSFSDIAFLLIIFFILVTSLAQLSGIVTDMPAGEKAEAKTEKTNIVNIHNGEITMNDAKIDMTGLKTKLAALELRTKKGNDKVVMLEARGKVLYQQYYEVVTAISAAGGVIAIVQEDEGSAE